MQAKGLAKKKKELPFAKAYVEAWVVLGITVSFETTP